MSNLSQVTVCHPPSPPPAGGGVESTAESRGVFARIKTPPGPPLPRGGEESAGPSAWFWPTAAAGFPPTLGKGRPGGGSTTPLWLSVCRPRIPPAIASALLAACILLFSQSTAHAHRLLVTHQVVQNELHIDIFFEDDSPADGAKVQLRQGDSVFAEGRADETGRWITPLPPPGAYVIHAQHSGHAAHEPLTVLGDASGEELAPTPRREDLVGVRWYRIAAGLGLLAAIMAGIGVVRFRRRNPTA